MLQIILLILKIIGWILLSLLGLLLALLLFVLFVPIRYQIRASHGEEYFRLESCVSWLLHIIHAKIKVKDSKLSIRLRIFGIVIFDNLRNKKVKRKKNTSKREIKRPIIKSKDNVQNKRNDINTVSEPSSSVQPKDAGHEVVKPIEQDGIKPSTFDEQEPRLEGQLPKQENVLRIPGNSKGKEKEQSRLKLLFEQIKDFLRNLKTKVVKLLETLKSTFGKWFESANSLRQKFNLIKAFFKDDINQQAFGVTFRSVKKLIKHVLPTKLKSSIIFGTGDPFSTGQALGGLAIIYCFYGDKVQITPDFEDKRFEGKHYAKGRIRLITVTIIVIKLIIDKRFKQLIDNMKSLKEAL